MEGQEKANTSVTQLPLTKTPVCAENPVMQFDGDGRLRWANQAAREQLGSFLQRNGELEEPLAQQLGPALQEHTVLNELHVGTRSYRVVPVRLSAGEETLLFWHDTTIRSRYLQISNLLEGLIDNACEGIIVADAESVIELVNPAFTRITGFSPEEAVGHTPKLLRSKHQEEEFYQRMWEALRTTGVWRGEIWNRKRNGEAVLVWECIIRISGDEGSEARYLALFHEIGESADTEERLFRNYYHDMLTGLPNRQLFFDRLSQAIASAKREKEMVAILLLDMDNFKKINDSLGHRAGDRYLQVIGKRLRSICREEDTIGRLGGDEFGIINQRLSTQNHALEILERIRTVLKKAVPLDGHDLVPSASIGVAFYPDDGEDSEELIKNADLALFKAKQGERGHYALFNQHLHQQAQQRLLLETSLRRAIDSEEFQLYYQPKIRAADGRIVGAEALVRWNHGGRVVSPADFIPIAEETGLIFALGRYVITEAGAALLKLQGELQRPFSLSVNVSAKQFRDPALVPQLRSILDNLGADPRGMVIEITENTAISDANSTLHMMEELKKLGIRVSIDDFGTGYSSLAYIKSFTATELKIDRSFIRDLPEDCGDRAIVKAVVSMAHELGMTVTAEGVETMEQHHLLQSLYCDELQGYYFSKPVPFNEFLQQLEGEEY
jgi:diguanylate cyclase (GGDEF)-like protein/PAS domain S-box-containing protein